MMLPRSIAPFEVVIAAVNYHNSDDVRTAADALFNQLMDSGLDVLLDDRSEAPGAKFADADLIGMPIRVVVSPRSLQDGGIELKLRNQPPSDAALVRSEDVFDVITSLLDV